MANLVDGGKEALCNRAAMSVKLDQNNYQDQTVADRVTIAKLEQCQHDVKSGPRRIKVVRVKNR